MDRNTNGNFAETTLGCHLSEISYFLLHILITRKNGVEEYLSVWYSGIDSRYMNSLNLKKDFLILPTDF